MSTARRKQALVGLEFTPHARRRRSQRGISERAIEAALSWGRYERQRDGRRVYHLGRRAVAAAAAGGADVVAYRYVGVVLAGDGAVVTVFRSPDTRRLRRRRQ